MRCPVCKTENADDAVKCILCGFDDVDPLFLNESDAEYWRETVLQPAIEVYYSEKGTKSDENLSEIISKKPIKYLIEEDIDSISLEKQFDQKSTNIRKGEKVTSIFVFSIKLKHESKRESSRYHFVMQEINNAIPQYVIFIIQHGSECQAWHFSKEKEKIEIDGREINRTKCASTGWHTIEKFNREIEGKDLDEVFNNLYTISEEVDK